MHTPHMTIKPAAGAMKYSAFRVGPLPTNKINQALGMDLLPGDVWVSKACHGHIARDHPEDYAVIIAAIFEIVAAPLYVGQDPKSSHNFYVVRRLPTGATGPFGLVAIGFEPNEFGGYNVRSAYALSQEDVDNRRAAQRLHSAI